VAPDDVSDRLAVSDLLDDYAYGVDTKDWALVASVFTEDAVLDYSAFGGPNGPAADVVAWIRDSVGNFPLTHHHITNRRIRVDGDTATCSAELFAPMGMSTRDEALRLLLTGGRYVDSFVRTPDGWRINTRVCENGWMGTGPDITRLS
jgi:ketosteroid isomerase-like protein